MFINKPTDSNRNVLDLLFANAMHDPVIHDAQWMRSQCHDDCVYDRPIVATDGLRSRTSANGNLHA